MGDIRGKWFWEGKRGEGKQFDPHAGKDAKRDTRNNERSGFVQTDFDRSERTLRI